MQINKRKLCTQWWRAILVATLAIMPALAQEEPAYPTVTQPAAISIVQRDSSATLTFVVETDKNKIDYQWYQSTDGAIEKGTLIVGANGSSYTTKVFAKREIRFYYCIATADEERIMSDVVAVAHTGLPILYINTEIPIDSITKEEYVHGNMMLVYENGEKFTYEFKTEKEGIKGRGNSSWGKPKKGYNIKFEKKQSFFGLPESKKWCIISNYLDKTLLRNKFASVLGNEIFNSEWNPHFESVDVVWNGEYHGNYILGEKITIEKGRIDIQNISNYNEKNIEFELFTDKNKDGIIDLYDGGFIIEIDKRDDANFVFQTTKGIHVTLKEPDEAPEETQNRIKHFIQTAEDVLYGDYFTDVENGWRNYFDEKSAIDWDFVNIFAPNPDLNYASVYRYYDPSDGKLHFGPIWDLDLGFGNRSENGAKIQWEQPEGWFNNTWIQQMFLDSVFFSNFVLRWNEKKQKLWEAIDIQFQKLADNNAISAECNFLKWKILGKYIWPNNAGAKNRKTYQSEIDYMANYMRERFEWFDKVLGNSFFISYNLNGGTLTRENAKVFVSESTPSFTLNNPTKYGYTFVGWSGKGIEGLSKTVVVTDDDMGNRTYTANWTRDFMVKDIALCDITFAEGEYVYNGSEIEPVIIVTDAGNSLVLGVDYAIKYMDNISAGMAKIIVSGIGDYSGEQEKLFRITPKPVVLNIANVSKIYREKDPELNYTLEGLVSSDYAENVLGDVVLFRQPGENVGEYAIASAIETVLNSNYVVWVNPALFTIKPDTTRIVVSVVGRADTAEYGGNEYVVHGFDMSVDNEFYSLDFVAFAGDSLVYGADAKTYPMGLASEDFRNTSPNYSNVVFDVTDGSLVVVPKLVVLSVADASKMYGAKDPEWDWVAEGLLPRDSIENVVKGVKVSREPGEDVGRYAITMTIDSIVNPNYTANIKDGALAIEPDTAKIVVKVTGHSDTVEYDGKKHAVYGFDMESSNDAYSLDFVNYAGDSLVLGKDAKTYPMGLAAYDFNNSSPNYSNVVFDIADGNLVIKPQEKNETVIAAPENSTFLRLATIGRSVRIYCNMLGEHYTIMDVQGVVVQTGVVESTEFDILVKKAGVYIIRVKSVMQRINVK